MNKHLHRIIFNAARGVRMAVQETATSTGKGRHASSGTASAVVALTAAFLAASPAQAQIIGAGNVPGSLRPTVLAAPNGVPLVNIQTPSAAGVSRNVYQQFDVQSQGVILNNSRGAVGTQLGANVAGNPWLAGAPARVILNEINSGNPSQLRGYIEVGGQRAEVIIANPAGISVDGAGFINASRATLTTGTPQMSAMGSLDSFLVRGGTITVEGQGLNAGGTDYAALIARALQVNAGIWASELQVVTGSNDVAADASTHRAVEPSGPAPAFALDVAQLGGMYARKIVLVGTEHGVGVRSAGVIGAQGTLAGPGSLVVTAAGRLENTGTVQSTGVARVQADSLANAGTLQSGDELDIRTQQGLSNAGGTLEGRRVLLASEGGDIDNRGGTVRQASSAGLGIEVQTLSNTAAGWIGAVPPAPPAPAPAPAPDAGAPPTPPAPSATPEVPAPSPAPGDSGAQSPAVPPAPVTPPAPGVIRAAGALLNDGGQVQAGGAIDIAPALIDNSGGTLQARALSATGDRLGNAGGTLQISGAFSATVGRIDNAGGTLSAASVQARTTGAIDNRGGTLQSDGAVQLGAGSTLDNSQGRITAFETLSVEAGAALSNAGGALLANQAASVRAQSLDNRGGLVQSAQAGAELHLAGALHNDGGSVNAAQGLQLNAGSVAGGNGIVRAGADGSIQVAGALATAGHTTAGGHLTITAASLDAGASSVLGAGVRADGSLATEAADPGDLRVRTTGTLAARGHNLAAGDVLLQGAALDLSGSSTQGASVQLQAASGPLDLRGASVATAGTLRLSTPQALDNSGGSLTAGGLDLQAASIRNVGGELIQTGPSATRLAVRGDIDNTRGRIASNGQDLSLSAAALLNDQGRIEHAGTGTLGVQVGRYQGQDGTVLGNGQLVARSTGAWVQNGGSTSAERITLEAASIANAGGQIVQWGQQATHIAATGALDNTGGRIATNGHSATLGAASIANASGRIEHAGSGAFALRSGGALDNQNALIASSGALDLDAGAVHNQGGRIDAQALDMAAASLSNQGGSVVQGGAADTRIALTGALDNRGGSLASNGQGITLSAAQVDNRAGRIEHAGTGAFNLDAGGRFTGDGGSLLSNGLLQLRATEVTHDGATLAAQGVAIATNRLGNRGGQILQTGADGALDITVRGELDNQAGGHIAANGASARIAAETVSNGGGLIAHAAAGGTLTLLANTLLDNTEGAIVGNGTVAVEGGELRNDAGSLSGAALAVQVSRLSNQGGQLLHTSTEAGFVEAAADLDNHQGLIATNAQDFALSAGGLLTNTEGVIQHAGTSSLALSAQAIDGAQGQIVSNGQLVARVQGAFDQQGGLLNAAQIDLQAASLDNRAGTVAQTGTGDIALDIGARLDNEGGLIATNGEGGRIAANTLVNSGGRIEHAGSGTLQLSGHSAIDNSSGTVLSNGALSLEGGTLTNDLGIISAQGLQADLGSLSNRQGRIVQTGTEAGALQVAGALDNHQGLIATNAQDFSLSAGGLLTNTEGVIQHAGNSSLALSAQAIDGAQGQIVSNGQLVARVQGAFDQQGGLLSAAQIDLQAASLDNRGGTVAQTGTGDIALDITDRLDNAGGLIATNGAGGRIAADTLANSGGRIEHAGSGALQLSGRSAIDNSSGTVLSNGTLGLQGGAVTNDLGLISAQGLQADLGSLSNREGRIVQAGTEAGSLRVTGALDNHQGLIATNAQDFALSAGGTLTNTDGAIQHAGSGSLALSARAIDGAQGQIVSNGQLVGRVQGAFDQQDGLLSAAQIDLQAASLDNREGTVTQTGTGDTAITVSGLLNNQSGLISTNAQGGRLGAGTLLNREGRVEHAGSGTFTVQTTQQLDNAQGLLASNGSLALRGGAVSNREGVVTARQIDADVAAFDNRQGQVQHSGSGTGRLVTRGALDNSGGQIATNGSDFQLSAGSLLSNTGGHITHAGGGRLGIQAGQFTGQGGQMLSNGLLDLAGGQFNHDGGIASGQQLRVNVAGLSNQRGQIVQNGAAATDIRVTGLLDNSTGLIVSNGSSVSVDAGRLLNRQGQLHAAAEGSDDGGAVIGGPRPGTGAGNAAGANGLLTVHTDDGLDNSGGQIVGNGRLLIDGGELLNGVAGGQGGRIGARQIGIDVDALGNQGGQIVQSGTGATYIGAATQLDNSGGLIATNGRDLSLQTQGTLLNNAGVIQHAGTGQLAIDAGLFDARGGQLLTGGDLAVTGGSFIHDGVSTTVRGLTVDVQHLSNSGGALLQTGNADTLIRAAQSLVNNAGGRIASAGTQLTVSSAHLNNDDGAIEHATQSEQGLLTVRTGQQLSNVSGDIIANVGLRVEGGHVDNSAGLLRGERLSLDVRSLDNLDKGRILQVGSTDTQLRIQGDVDNSGGQIASNGHLSVSAANWTQHGGELRSATDKNLTLDIDGLLDNGEAGGVGGAITSGAELVVRAAELRNDAATDPVDRSVGSRIQAEAGADFTLTGAASSQGGTLAAGQSLRLSAQGLDTSGGTVAALDGDLRLTVQGLTRNHRGTLQASGDVHIDTGDLVNTGDATRAGSIHGQNLNVTTHVTGLRNDGGTLWARDALHLDLQHSDNPGGLSNNAGLIQSGGALVIDTHGGVLLNHNASGHASAAQAPGQGGGGIISGAALSVASGEVHNSSGGFIGAQGDIGVLANTLNNDGGAILGMARTGLGAGNISNQGGSIQSKGHLLLSAEGGTLDNRGGLIRSMERSELIAATVDNRGSAGTEQGIEGATVQITTPTLNNQGGAVRASGNATVTSAGHINNSAGLISAGGVLHLQDAGVAQGSGSAPTLVVTNTNGTLVGDKGLLLDVARFTPDGKLISGADLTLNFQGDVVNQGQLIAAGNLNYSTDGTLTNQGKISAGQVLHAKAAGLVNAAGAEISAGHTLLEIAGSVTNRGLIDSRNQTIIKAGGSIDNIGTGKIYGGAVILSANRLTNSKEGGISATIAARDSLAIGVQSLTNRDGALIYSKGSLAIGGAIDESRGTAVGSGASLENLSATIESGGSMNIAMGTVLNKDIYLTVGQPTVKDEHEYTWGVAHPVFQYAAPLWYAVDENTYYQPNADGTVGVLMHRAAPDEAPQPIPTQDYRLFDIKTTTTTDVATGAKPAQIIAGQDIRVEGLLRNHDGQVVAGGNIYAQGPDNKSTQGRIVTDTYTTMYTATTLSKTEIDLSQWWLTLGPDHKQSSTTFNLGQHRYEGGAVVNVGDKAPGASGAPTTQGSKQNPGGVNGAGAGTIIEVALAVDSGQSVNADGTGNIGPGGTVQNAQGQNAQSGNGPGANNTGTTQLDAASGGTDSADGESASKAQGGTEGVNGQNVNSAQGGADSVHGPGAQGAKGGAGDAGAQGAGAANASTANAAVGASGPGGTSASATADRVVRTMTPNVGVPSASIYVTHPGSGSKYLIGTDPVFTQGATTVSSDQLLVQLGLSTNGGSVQAGGAGSTVGGSGEYTLKRLGDGWYEQDLIKQQIVNLTGYRYLSGYDNDAAQYTALINAGATFAKQYNLQVGVALTAAQMAQLTSDIVWLVEQTVTLPDGTRERVLVPQVYVRAKKGDIDGSGALLSGNQVFIDAPEGQNVFNSGTIAGRDLVSIKADTIENLGGRISSTNAVSLDARQDIRIVGGTVDAGNKIELKAAGDIDIRTTTSTTTTPNGLATTTVIDRVAGLYVTNPGGTLVASAGNDLNIVGAVIRNSGKDSVTELTAGKNVNITTVKTASQVTAIGTVGAATGYVVSNKAQEVGSVIDVGGKLNIEAKGGDLVARQADIRAVGDITLTASQDVRLEAGVASASSSSWGQTERMTVAIDTASNRSVGTAITSSGGKIDITAERDFASRAADVSAAKDLTVTAERDIFIGTGWDSQANSISQSETDKGLLSSKTTDIHAVAIVDKATGGTFSGQNVILQAGTRDESGAITNEGNLSLVGVDVIARGDATLRATGNVNIVSAQESSTLVADRSESRSGLFGVGGVPNTHAWRGDTATQETTTHRGSSITAGGKIDVNAGGSATVYASDLTAQDTVRITGKDVNLISGVNTASGSYGAGKSSDGESGFLPRMGTGFGNEANSDSSVTQSTLAPTRVTGKSVTLTATDGDITLAAAHIKSTGTPEADQPGVTLNAEQGAVNLVVVKTGEQVSHSTSGSDIAYQRSSDEGHVKEEGNYTRIETAAGGQDVKINTSTVNVGVGQTALRIGEGDQAFLIPVQTIAGVLDSQSGQPGMEWIDQLKAKEASGELKVNWEGVPLEYRQWAQDQSGLTGAGAAVITAVVTYFTAGTATSWATAAADATVTATGSATMGVLVKGAVIAGVTTLASQTAISLINNNGDLGKVLHELGSSGNIKQLVSAMATGGVLQGLDLMPTGGATVGQGAGGFLNALAANAQAGAASAVIDTILYGGSLGDRLEDNLKGALIKAAAASTSFAIGTADLDRVAHTLAHAMAGCVAGMATAGSSGGCAPGGLGAAIGELAAGQYDPMALNANGNTVQFAGLMASLAVALAGGSAEDIAIANAAGQNAAANNWLATQQKIQMDRELAAATSVLDKALVFAKWSGVSAKQDVLTANGIGRGLVEAGIQDVQGLAQFMANPVEGVKGLIQIISDPQVRQELGDSVFRDLEAKATRIQTALDTGGDYEAYQLGRDLGSVIYTIAGTAAGIGAVAKVGGLAAESVVKVAATQVTNVVDLKLIPPVPLSGFHQKYPLGAGAATGSVPNGYVTVSRWVSVEEASEWIANQGTAIPNGVGTNLLGTNTTTVYVTAPGAAKPGGTGPIRVDFAVPADALQSAGNSQWSQIYQPIQSTPIYNVIINVPDGMTLPGAN